MKIICQHFWMAVLFNASSLGIRKELMPSAKPKVKNISPTKAKGTTKFLLDSCFIIPINFLVHNEVIKISRCKTTLFLETIRDFMFYIYALHNADVDKKNKN